MNINDFTPHFFKPLVVRLPYWCPRLGFTKVFMSSLSLPVGARELLHMTTTLIGWLPLSFRNQSPLKNKQTVAECERNALLYLSGCLTDER